MSNVPEIHCDEAATATDPRPTSSPHRILVVDDDTAVRQQCAELLTDSGYHVDAAEDGAIAWDTLQRNGYDLLVTDHSMPKVTGVDLVKKLRAARMALPVILVSGSIPIEELNRHPWLQLAATLLKPFTSDELLATVKEALRASAGATELNPSLPNAQNQASPDRFRL